MSNTQYQNKKCLQKNKKTILIYFDNKVYSTDVSLLLLTKSFAILCFPIRSF